MSYYDNVKDDVKDKGDSSKPNFDTLRQAAEEHSENEDKQEGDDTEIEVLNETGLKSKSSPQNQQQTRKQPQQNNQTRQKTSQNRQQVGSQQQKSQRQNASNKSNVDRSGVEQKLDKIIEQNKKMIDILESFGS